MSTCCPPQVHAGVVASADSVPLTSLDVRAVGLLLASIGLGQFQQAFVAAGISGMDLAGLERNEDLEELGIKVPSLKFRSLKSTVGEVGV